MKKYDYRGQYYVIEDISKYMYKLNFVDYVKDIQLSPNRFMFNDPYDAMEYANNLIDCARKFNYNLTEYVDLTKAEKYIMLQPFLGVNDKVNSTSDIYTMPNAAKNRDAQPESVPKSVPESVKVLYECIELQLKKSRDYQNPNSNIKQADYYPSGCLTILETMHAKVLRMRSVMEAMMHDKTYSPNFESLEDSAKDIINYASFFVSYSRGDMDGQYLDRDFLNRPKTDIA